MRKTNKKISEQIADESIGTSKLIGDIPANHTQIIKTQIVGKFFTSKIEYVRSLIRTDLIQRGLLK